MGNFDSDFSSSQKRFLNALVCVFASLSILGLLFIICSYVLLEITRNERRKRNPYVFDVREESRSKVILFSCESVLIEFDCGFRSEIGFCE